MSKNGNPGYFLPQTLDVDERIFDRNLRIIDGDEASGFVGENEMVSHSKAPFGFNSKISELQSLFPSPDYPSVEVTPSPGVVIKTKNVKGEKVFINLCKIPSIPPAAPLSEEELIKIIEAENYSSSYRVPMSLGAPREEVDKGGNPCIVSDVALNSVWFEETLEHSLVFTAFVVTLAMEGLCDKYGDQVNCDRKGWNVLKNKKYMGKIQRHKIQQRGDRIKEIVKNQQTLKAQHETSFPRLLSAKNPTIIQELDSQKAQTKSPKFKLIREPPGQDKCPDFIIAEIQLPLVKCTREITLDLGEDRIILESRPAYSLDIFLPLYINQEEVSAEFHRDNKILTITMPISST